MSVLSLKLSVDPVAPAAPDWQCLLAQSIRTAAQYSVELRAGEIRKLRANLEALAVEAEAARDHEAAKHVEVNFRAELRDYRDTAQAEIEQLRNEIVSLMDSLQQFMGNVGGSTEDLKQTLNREFTALETTAESGDIEEIRGAIHHAVESAARSCEEAQRAQELLTAQLQDEIRNLHRVVEAERKSALSDPLTGLWNRTKLDSRIKDLLLLNEGFCVFLVGLPAGLQLSFSDPRIWSELLKAMAGRLKTLSGKGGELGMAGRWSEEIFALVFNLPLSGAPASSAEIEKALSGDYAVHLDGDTLDISATVLVKALDRPKDFAEGPFYLQLGQAAFHATAR